ncbi:vWA domain-containing protein [Bdellovibrio sp. HCB337]|uniref:vWA domain-containing protein n=1 Tax=Bdellovibrio sp. HCB337 TaxID=3394358 RepID=UPI0039A691EA
MKKTKWFAVSSFVAVSVLLAWGIRSYEDNKIPVVLEITPEMMAEAEEQKPLVFEEPYAYRDSVAPRKNSVVKAGRQILGKEFADSSAIGGDGYGGKGRIAKRKAYLGSGHYKYPPAWGPPSYQEENLSKQVSEEPLSTFSLDVDTASYSKLRDSLAAGQLPYAEMIRIEEMVNYFSYDYAPPEGAQPLAVSFEMAQTPWNKQSRLLRIAVKSKEVSKEERPASNLVFLVDTSGSMAEYNKLPLVKKSLNLLVDELRPQDRVALVVYAGSAGVYLNSTSGGEKTKIKAAIAAMNADGTTNGSGGIELAYKIASKNFIRNGINRVILATDGDFNVGISNSKELEGFIAEKAKSGVFLSVLGFGMRAYNDETILALANKGNGNYGFVDNLREGRKYLVEQAAGTLMTVAKDVKAQVEFDPRYVSKYRLVGYEKRKLNNEDFANDAKDAGDVGAGHTVTVFYEVFMNPKVENEIRIASVKLRYKKPQGSTSELIEAPVVHEDKAFAKASGDFQFAASVVELGQILRGSIYKGTGTFDQVLEIAMGHTQVRGQEDSYRKEFLELVKKAKDRKNRRDPVFGGL